MSTKITLRPEGVGDDSQDVVLADGADRSADNVRGPAAGTVNVAIGVQQFNAIRAAGARFFNRGNRAGTYTFEASRRFAAIADAGRFMLTHGMEVPASGTLIIDFGDSGDVVLLLGCVLRQVGLPRRVGVHIATSYSVSFGHAVAADPDDIQDTINEFFGYVVSRSINCGGVAATGWEADDEDLYTGSGGDITSADSITGSGTVPEAVYQTLRWGALLTYYFDVPDGIYDIVLHFAETTYDAAEERLFDVRMNGNAVEEDLDVFDEVGALTALVKTHTVAVTGGVGLTIEFDNTVGGAFVCGISYAPHVVEEET